MRAARLARRRRAARRRARSRRRSAGRARRAGSAASTCRSRYGPMTATNSPRPTADRRRAAPHLRAAVSVRLPGRAVTRTRLTSSPPAVVVSQRSSHSRSASRCRAAPSSSSAVGASSRRRRRASRRARAAPAGTRRAAVDQLRAGRRARGPGEHELHEELVLEPRGPASGPVDPPRSSACARRRSAGRPACWAARPARRASSSTSPSRSRRASVV